MGAFGCYSKCCASFHPCAQPFASAPSCGRTRGKSLPRGSSATGNADSRYKNRQLLADSPAQSPRDRPKWEVPLSGPGNSAMSAVAEQDESLGVDRRQKRWPPGPFFNIKSPGNTGGGLASPAFLLIIIIFLNYYLERRWCVYTWRQHSSRLAVAIERVAQTRSPLRRGVAEEQGMCSRHASSRSTAFIGFCLC